MQNSILETFIVDPSGLPLATDSACNADWRPWNVVCIAWDSTYPLNDLHARVDSPYERSSRNASLVYARVSKRWVDVAATRRSPMHSRQASTLEAPRTEYCVFPVKPWRGCQRNEELRAVCIRSGVCHGENACARMLELLCDLVLELIAID
eukprot:COSAG02_NODE_204_length_29210_cov_36.596579_4_plen_151_part_00